MRIVASLLISGLMSCVTLAAFAADHIAKVAVIQGLSITQDCVYFTLEGVATADPVAPNNPYFAVARSQYGSKDAYAMLLVAKTTGASVRATTTGATVCGGYAQVSQVMLL